MNYTFVMDFPAPPPPFHIDIGTLHILVAVTFLLQSVVIGFHTPLSRRYRGIRTFLVSAVVLACGSLVLIVQGWLPPGPLGLASNGLLLWGAALQYVALSNFLEKKAPRALVWGWPAVGAVYLAALALGGAPPQLYPLRELLPMPFLFAAAFAVVRADTQGFRTGAILTALPFAGYALRSAYRLVLGFIDPELQLPGPNINHAFDALSFFVFSLLWTSGFLLMVNQRLQSDLVALATRDPLTQCLNRRAMSARLDEEHLRFVRYSRRYTVVLLDLDRFKAINDTRGHDVGDKVLVRVAEVLRGALRSGDHLARWGGEEFLLLLPETPEPEGTALAERLRLLVEAQVFEIPGLAVTFSAGVAGVVSAETVDSVCRRADQALYRAKETRNRVVTAP